LNAADNQTQNLNYNLQNPNLTNPGSGKFLRDYDKEPIILKNYEEAYQVLLSISPFIIGAIVTLFVCDNNNYADDIGIVTGCIYMLLFILFFALGEFYRYKKERPVLKIKNSSIEFYEKGKRVFVSKCDDLRKFIYKPFFTISKKPRNWLFWFAIAPMAFYLIYIFTLSSYVTRLALCFAVFNLLGIFLTKFFFCLILGGKNAKFSSFLVICIDEPHNKPGSFWGVPHGNYFTITIVDKDTYREVKGYFLSKHGVNIDEIDKVYF